MDSDSINQILIISLILIVLMNLFMWYLYGAVDSINYASIEDENNEIHKKLMRYVGSYHTKLLVLNMILFASAIYVSSKLKYSYILCFIIVILTILIKHLGYHKAEKINSKIFNISNAIYTIFYPIVFIFSFIINCITMIVGLNTDQEYNRVTEDEIISIVNDGHEQGLLDKEEAEMINNIVELGEKEARDIMTHRKNLIVIDSNKSFAEVYEIIMSTKFSRYPVFKDEVDNIIGIIHIRDFLKHYNTSDRELPISSLPEMLRKPYFVPNTKDVNDIFKEMQSEKNHMAIIIDEYGQLDGILTMEDIIEEIMGNILDEYDVDETMIIEKSKDVFIVRGICPLEIIEERLNISFDDEFETLNGFLTSKLNKIPTENEGNLSIEYEGYRFVIKKVKNKVIQLVKITKLV